MSEELGSAHVKITADTSGLDAGIDASKAKVEQLGDSTAKSVKKGLAPISEVKQVFSHMLGIVGLIATPILAAGNALDQMEKKAKAASDALVKLREEARKIQVDTAKSLEEAISPSSEMDKEIERAAADADKRVKAFQDEIATYSKWKDKEKKDAAIAKAEEQIAATYRLFDQAEAAIVKRSQAKSKAAAEKEASDRAEIALRERLESASLAQEAIDATNEYLKAQALERLEIEKRISEERINGIMEASKALEAMYARQAAGFGNNDGSSSIQGGFDMLAREIQAGFSRMGNGA